jgi:hypothetical protein
MGWLVLHKSSDNIAPGVVGEYKYFMIFVCVCITATSLYVLNPILSYVSYLAYIIKVFSI